MWYKIAKQKTMYILRGPSGAGKSTLAKKLGINGVVLSTDDFWMQNGKYIFDPLRISEAHKWNQDRTRKLLENGEPSIIIDNTNIELWEMKPYVIMAQEFGYNVKIIPVKVNLSAEELAKRNKHDVPANIIQKMIDNYDPNASIDDILKSKLPINTERNIE